MLAKAKAICADKNGGPLGSGSDSDFCRIQFTGVLTTAGRIRRLLGRGILKVYWKMELRV